MQAVFQSACKTCKGKAWNASNSSSCFRLFLLGLRFLGCLGSFGIGIILLKDYGEWGDALAGQCKYDTSEAISCKKGLNKCKSCYGLRAGHLYFVRNETEARARCSTVTFVEDTDDISCRCGISNHQAQLTPPENADGAWHTCYVKDCGSGGVTFAERTEMTRVIGILLFILSALLGIFFMYLVICTSGWTSKTSPVESMPWFRLVGEASTRVEA